MIKKIFLLIGVFFFIQSHAQIVGENQLGNGFILTKEKNLEVEGSPYLNEEFNRGKIFIGNKEPLNVYLRYNVLDEAMEVKVDPQNEDIYTFSSNGKIQYELANGLFSKDMLTVDGEKIYGIFKELYAGNKIRLLEKSVAKKTEPVVAVSSYDSDKPGRIIIDQRYFVEDNDGMVREVETRNRTLKKVFRSKEVKKYLKDNRVRSVEDLQRFVRFYDSL